MKSLKRTSNTEIPRQIYDEQKINVIRTDYAQFIYIHDV